MTEPQLPEPLGYRGHSRGPRPSEPPPSRFWIALIAGTAFSLVAWLIAFEWKSPQMTALLVAVPLAKIVVGGTLLAFQRWRPASAGVFLSMVLGALIFFGLCVTHLG